MNTVRARDYQTLSQLKLFLALSRTHHLLLDLATPCLGALLWLGTFPAADVVVLGLLTAFAGYTAVYALNDLVDYRTDQEKVHYREKWDSAKDLDNVYVRHPIAQGLLGLKKGVVWTGAWGLLALAGSYLLNPLCALIFLVACALEAVYCLLLRVSSLRTLVSGMVKCSGGIAAVLAVESHPSLLFLAVFFFWIFLWEIGGQNVPNDWADLEEDRELRARTVPVQAGLPVSGVIIVLFLSAAVLLSAMLPVVAPPHFSPLFYLGALGTGFYLLLLPGYRLYKTRSFEAAGRLFGAASYYPAGMLVVVIVSLLL